MKRALLIVGIPVALITIGAMHGCAHGPTSPQPQPTPCRFEPVDGGQIIICQ